MLWVDKATAAEMKPFADKLDTDVAKLVSNVKTANYQTAQIAIRMLLNVTWAMRRTGMVQYLTGVSWAPA